jgi:hypothetical protein
MGTLINAVICEVHQTKPQEKDSQLAIWSNSHCASQLWCNLKMQRKTKKIYFNTVLEPCLEIAVTHDCYFTQDN